MAKIELAANFAKEKHKDQKRKYTGEPYFNHCEEVAQILIQYGINDEDMICAAYLHDTIEDTDTTYEEIEITFGKYCADLVLQLTDISKPSDGNRKVRKEIDRQHIANASAEAQTIKLADLISNAKSIVQNDPDFAKVYLEEKKKLMEVLIKKGNMKLYHIADATLGRANDLLNKE